MRVTLADAIPSASRLTTCQQRTRYGLLAWSCGAVLAFFTQAASAQLKDPLVPPAVANFSLDPSQGGLRETLWIAKARTYKFGLRFADTGKTLAEKTRVWDLLSPPNRAKRQSKNRPVPLRFKLEIRDLENPDRAPVYSKVVDTPRAIRVDGAMTKNLAFVKLEPGEYEVTLVGVQTPATLHPVRTSLNISFNPKADIGAQ